MSDSTTTLARRTLTGGLTVHPIGMGCWPLGGPGTNLGLPMGWSGTDDVASLAGLETAYAEGVNLFDTADVYGHGHSERMIGRFLYHGVRRQSVVLSSKVGYFAGTAEHPYLPSHMRRQLETTLENLETDYLDIYFLHNANFGPGDRYLDGAVEQMRAFQAEGLIRCVGMRGPHRFATDRLTVPKEHRTDKHHRFRYLFDRVRPEYLAVRYNALTPPPPDGRLDIFAFAAEHGASVLINKPLAQGLLTGKYDPEHPPEFGPGDIRLRKFWFTGPALEILDRGLDPWRDRFGADRKDLVRVALRYCVQRAANAAVLVGFTHPQQVRENLEAVRDPLSDEDVAFIRETAGRIQQELDAAGEVFLDETEAPRP
jgi:aryl-alcohol dehydrogenase-like predicted oxidoreductase